MKILPLVVLCCCSILVLSESRESSKEDLLSRASAQLERLAPYRRTSTEQKASNEQWQLLDNASKDANRILREQRTAFEIYKLLPEKMQIDIAKRIGADRATIELLGDPKYIEMMQDRIKRSGSKRDYSGPEEYDHPPDGYHYGGYDTDHGEHHESSGSDSGGILKGSGSLIGGIANGIIGGLVSASSSASKGSSSVSASSASSSSSSSSDSGHKKPEYGHTYSVTM
nr:uncharacterized protein LOC117607169 [Osmia lignaria]